MEEKESKGMDEENEDEWVEVEMPIPPPIVPKCVPRLLFSQQRSKEDQAHAIAHQRSIVVSYFILMISL